MKNLTGFCLLGSAAILSLCLLAGCASAATTSTGQQTTTAPGAAPQSTPAAMPSDLSATLAQALDNLSRGQILYNPPAEMTVAQKETVEVRIIQDTSQEATEALQQNLQGHGVPQVEAARVAPVMKAVLMGDQDAFKIIALSSEEQPVGESSYTEWLWQVTPLQAGDQELYLRVSAVIELPGYEKKTKDLPVIAKTIQIKVDPIYSASMFVQDNWQWIVTVLFIPLAGWAWQALSRRKSGASREQ